MVSALNKATKVSKALKQFTSESEFWEWYEREIKEVNKIENDLLTFREAIALYLGIHRLVLILILLGNSIPEKLEDVY